MEKDQAKGEGHEHVQESDIEGVYIIQKLGINGKFVRVDEIGQKDNESVRIPLASMLLSLVYQGRKMSGISDAS